MCKNDGNGERKEGKNWKIYIRLIFSFLLLNNVFLCTLFHFGMCGGVSVEKMEFFHFLSTNSAKL